MSHREQLPIGWRKKRLEHVADVQTGIAKNQNSRGETISLPYLRVANVQDGYLDLSDIKTIDLPPDKFDRYALQEGDVLLTEGGDFDKLGRGSVWRGQIDKCVHQNHVFAVRPNQSELLPFFLSALTSSDYGKKYFLRCSKQSTNLASINSSQLKAFPVLLPPLAEQRAIADLLSTWDEAIEKTGRLTQAKKLQYKHLVQEQIHRVDSYDEVRLRDISTPITAKNTVCETNVLTSSAEHGLISQLEYYNKSVSAEDVSGYYLLERGDFAYNRSSATGYPYGAIKRLDRYERGVLSTLYLCFRLTNTESVDSNYLADLFEAGVLNKQLRGICQAGARSHGLLNVTKSDFFSLKVPLPEMAKQKEIAAKLDLARKEIEVLETLQEKYELQKRGLMQKLLTGEWRMNTAKEVA